MSKAIETIIVRLGLTVTSYESLHIITASHPIYDLPTSSEGKLSLKNIDDQSTHQFELDEKFVSLLTFMPFQPFLWRPLSWWNCMLRCTRTFQQPNLAITPLNQTLQLLWMNWFQIGGFGWSLYKKFDSSGSENVFEVSEVSNWKCHNIWLNTFGRKKNCFLFTTSPVDESFTRHPMLPPFFPHCKAEGRELTNRQAVPTSFRKTPHRRVSTPGGEYFFSGAGNFHKLAIPGDPVFSPFLNGQSYLFFLEFPNLTFHWQVDTHI